MYSVFIVDDEVIVREGIRNVIDWDNTPFSFSGEASDGELALSMIQDIKPDILLTDIRMPFMDGLELAKTVKKLYPWMRIIILSGHDEFEYAKKAISIGVDEYLLKPFTSEELLSCMNRIAEELDSQKKQYQDIKHLKDELATNNILQKEKLLTDIVLGVINNTDAIEKSTELGIELISRFYIVAICKIFVNEDESSELIKAKSSLHALCNAKENVIGFSISPDSFVYILKSNVNESAEEEAYSVADEIKHEINTKTNGHVVVALGTVADRTASICNSYHEAENILKICSVSNKDRILSVSDLNKSEGAELSLHENDPLVERLKYAADGEIDKIISQYMETLGSNSSHFSIVASYLLVDVIMAVSKLIEYLGGDIKEVMPEILSHEFVTNAVQNQDIFISEIRRVLVFILSYRNSRMQGRYGEVILRAKKYIDENYANPDICLHSVAEKANFSPNHFSAIFSQECGITFIEYLTETRIEKAKILLKSTSMRSADIAYEVGFNDPHYFSFIFKKTCGLSPREYRNNAS